MDEIFQLYEKFKLSIKETQEAFASVPKTEYFYELCFCLLTPATKAEHALRAIEILKRKKFFELGFNPVNVLRGYETDGTPTIKFYIRFHNTKAKRLQSARLHWKRIMEILESNISSSEKRKLLVENVDGFGYKEASHFLRNIGYKDFAILDRHILKNLVHYGVIPEETKISSPRKYLEIESIFIDFANSIGIRPADLDLLFWAKETGYVLK